MKSESSLPLPQEPASAFYLFPWLGLLSYNTKTYMFTSDFNTIFQLTFKSSK
jgi:hypothetical protein